MAEKAEYLRQANRRTAWQAAIASAFLACVLTIGVAWTLAYTTGSVAQDRAIEHNAEEIKGIVNQARLTQCLNAREHTKLLVDLPGTPSVASIQECEALPKVKYGFYQERK